jgi:hypothetical protein
MNSDTLKFALIAAAAAYLFRDRLGLSNLFGGGSSPAPVANTPDPPYQPEPPQVATPAMLKAAAAYPEYAAKLADTVTLTADQWAYYYNQVTNKPAPEVYDPANRGALITAKEFHRRRSAAGVLSGLGIIRRRAA